jgi:hypothetical protein
LPAANSGWPPAAAETEVTIPDKEVLAPKKSAPVTAWPIPVLRASSAAVLARRVPTTATKRAATAKITPCTDSGHAAMLIVLVTLGCCGRVVK